MIITNIQHVLADVNQEVVEPEATQGDKDIRVTAAKAPHLDDNDTKVLFESLKVSVLHSWLK